MIYLILSFFDNRIGPRTLLTFPHLRNIRSNVYYKKIPILMDLYDKGFFIHEFGKTRTANMIFNVYNPSARGRQDRAMLSIMSLNEGYNINLGSFKEIMECLILNLKEDSNIYKAFRYKEGEKGLEYFSKMRDLLFSFHKSLTVNNLIKKNKLVQVPTYSLSAKEKSNIINFIENSSFDL